MARQGRSSNPASNGGRRGNASSSSAPFSSSSYSGGNSNKPRRPRPSSDGPKGLHDVYDFAQASTSASSKQGKGARRALAGMNADDYADLPSKAKGKQPRRRRGDDDEDEDEDEDSDDGDDGPIGPKVFDSEDELNQGIEGSDEELDSDEAFGESDEEKFDGWTFGKGRKQTRKADSDDEDEEEDEEDQGEDDEGMMDLSRMLDSASSSSEQDSDDENQDSDDDEDNDQSSSKLARHIESFAAGSKRPTATSSSGSDDDDAPSSKRTRRVLSERTEAVPETEFAPSASSTLRLEDFMNPLSSNIDFADVRKSTKLLANTSRPSSSTSAPVASKRGGGALSAPLPTVVQDRLDRQGAYATTRDEVQGWQPTINRLRSAEHLSFPLQAPTKTAASTSGLVATFVPSNDMESSIASMLTEGGLTEAQLAAQEDLAMNKLDPAEARARRDELRRMRMLMFRAEQKAKRVSKIKSKAYRKIARKEKEKLKAQMNEFASDAEDDEDEGMEERMKAERERARERATLKHKNTSKWAKNILSSRHGEHTQEARMELEAQLRRGAELRAKIDARELGSDVSSDEYSSEEEGEGDVARDAFDELEALERKDEAKRRTDEEEFERVGGKKGVYNMKFMKDARERQYAAIRGDVDDFVTQMQQVGADAQEGSEGEDEDEGEVLIARKGAEPEEAGGKSMYVQGNKGRAMYGASSASASASNAKPAAEEENEDTTHSRSKPTSTSSTATTTTAGAGGVEIGGDATVTKSNTTSTARPSKPKKSPLSASAAPAAAALDDDEDDASNPWLAVSSTGQTTRISRKNNTSSLTAEAASKSALKASKASSKSATSLAARRADERVELDLDSHLHNSPSEDEEIYPEAIVSRRQAAKSGVGAMTAIQQRDLVASAFAGDDVVADFAAEKAATIEADEAKTIDTRLPGWGSWTGKGIRTPTNPNPKYLKKTAGVAKEQRKDAKMTNVIISEKRDKKQDKFTLASLPHPYTCVAQYKAALAQPLGKEWNTRIETQRLNMPRVTKKPGKVIAPVVRKF